mmetsp:Transcript_35939/g.98987  ORF Transcript_35939/g.98987 Transcript_35939/m.98987 type:complete len:267 (-) Transcript_35939:1261-2061(-)
MMQEVGQKHPPPSRFVRISTPGRHSWRVRLGSRVHVATLRLRWVRGAGRWRRPRARRRVLRRQSQCSVSAKSCAQSPLTNAFAATSSCTTPSFAANAVGSETRLPRWRRRLSGVGATTTWGSALGASGRGGRIAHWIHSSGFWTATVPLASQPASGTSFGSRLAVRTGSGSCTAETCTTPSLMAELSVCTYSSIRRCTFHSLHSSPSSTTSSTTSAASASRGTSSGHIICRWKQWSPSVTGCPIHTTATAGKAQLCSRSSHSCNTS